MSKIKSSKSVPLCPNCNSNRDISIIDSNKFDLFFCNECSNGFLFPVPKNLNNYYPQEYWQFPGQLAFIRKGLHDLLQFRRKRWVTKYLSDGEILDVGAGEGVFGKILGPKFKVTNLEFPSARVKNKNVLKKDFIKWKTEKKFDGIVFLESLEHVPNPQKYIGKAASLLKKGGYIFIECPRFDSLESKFFGEYWLHRDLPRHLSQLTEKGLAILAKRCKLANVNQGGILLYEYSPYCFVISLMFKLGIKTPNLKRNFLSNVYPLFLLIILSPIAFIAETVFYYLKQAPVELSVFQKK